MDWQKPRTVKFALDRYVDQGNWRVDRNMLGHSFWGLSASCGVAQGSARPLCPQFLRMRLGFYWRKVLHRPENSLMVPGVYGD